MARLSRCNEFRGLARVCEHRVPACLAQIARNFIRSEAGRGEASRGEAFFFFHRASSREKEERKGEKNWLAASIKSFDRFALPA